MYRCWVLFWDMVGGEFSGGIKEGEARLLSTSWYYFSRYYTSRFWRNWRRGKMRSEEQHITRIIYMDETLIAYTLTLLLLHYQCSKHLSTTWCNVRLDLAFKFLSFLTDWKVISATGFKVKPLPICFENFKLDVYMCDLPTRCEILFSLYSMSTAV